MKKANLVSTTIAVLLSRIATVFCKLRRSGGTSFPGVVALKICPNILSRVADGVKTVYVLGSNGKSTTTKMIYHLLQEGGVSVFYNKSGANMTQGLVNTYIQNATITGKPKYDVGVIECDELFFGQMIKKLPAEVVVCNNLFDDQVDRLGGPEKVRDGWSKIFNSIDTTLVVNVALPVLRPLMECQTGHKAIGFELKDGKAVVDGEAYEVNLTMPGEYNKSNAAAAIAVAKHFGVFDEKNLKAIETMTMPFGRMEKFDVGGVKAMMNLIKNPAGTEPVLETFYNKYKETGQKYNMVLGVNNEIADGVDTTWLWDTDFEATAEAWDKVYLFGACRKELKDRMAKAGIKEENLTIVEEADSLVACIEQSDKPVAVNVNYTCMMVVRSAIAKAGYLPEFWDKK